MLIITLYSHFLALGPIEFVVPGKSSSYIDLLNTLLHVRARIKKQDGAILAEYSNVVSVCNFLCTLWSQCDFYVNGSLISQSSNFTNFEFWG